MNSLLQKYSIIKSKRQAPNLKKLLTRAKYEESGTEAGIRKCGRPRCKLCNQILECDKYQFRSGKEFTFKFSGTCDILNLIYVLRCAGCNRDYIGETVNLRNRVILHNQHIRNPDTAPLPVSRHIAECARTQQPQFYISPLYKLKTDDAALRKIKEDFFIKLFKPELNR